MRKRGLLIAFVVLGCALVVARFAAAAVTVTPASGGTNISADNAANATTPAWTTLGNIVVAEAANGDFAQSQTNTTMVLSAPTNWQFNAGAGSVSFTGSSPGSADLTAASISVTTSTITVTLSTDSNANKTDQLTIAGIQVSPDRRLRRAPLLRKHRADRRHRDDRRRSSTTRRTSARSRWRPVRRSWRSHR